MKKTISAVFFSILVGAGLVSCGTGYGGQTGPGTTGPTGTSSAPSTLNFRAFVSNPFNPTITGGVFPGLNIIDASHDLLSQFDVDLSTTTPSAGLMVETPKRDRTVVFSPTTDTSPGLTGNKLGIVNNATEAGAGSVALPGPTESMFVWVDNTTLFTAIPAASVNGQPAGAVLEVNIANQTITATIPVAGARYVIPSPSGNQILVISDSANSVSVLRPALIANGDALTTVDTTSTGTDLHFDRPVWAVFSPDGATAYVMNCGAECGAAGGAAPSIAVVSVTASQPAVLSKVPVPAATIGLLDKNGNLYVAGTPLASGADCVASLCGVLTVFPSADLTAAPATFPIADGYHNRMAEAQNGQIFIGSRTCTNIIASGSTPGRGCLSVFNAAGGNVYTASQNGDVTGIEPILSRSQVYVCEGGAIRIYDTSKDLGSGAELQLQKTQVGVTGKAIDVKLADF
ncbi:MAG: hypothetical protein J2P13_06225 [Acidobacteria bacterium]|nr:hypothetical protein [Acidobacteriota bacterium]